MNDPLFDLEGRVAVVTGGMGQLGSVYTAGLVERGMRVAVLDVAAGDVPHTPWPQTVRATPPRATSTSSRCGRSAKSTVRPRRAEVVVEASTDSPFETERKAVFGLICAA